MERHLLVPGTIFFKLQPAGCILFVFARGVVTPFALGASEQNVYAHALLQNFGNHARANGTAAFTNGEAHALLHGDWRDNFHDVGGLFAGNKHLHPFLKTAHACDVGGTVRLLRTVAGQPRRTPRAFLRV